MLAEMTASHGSCRRRRHSRGRRASRFGLALVLALALIVFGRVDDVAERAAGGAARLDSRADHLASRRPLVLLASGAYLDSVGQLTNVMNELVNSVLEKVSFLAEIIIESALDEECAAPFAGEAAAGQLDQAACRRYEARHNLSRTASKIATAMSNKQPIERIKFDRDEFKNVDLFVSQYLGSTRGANSAAGGCKLFTIDIDSKDLPADDMGICCGQFHQCYARCGSLKSECDSELRYCLNRICKANFNYKNETLAREFAGQPNGNWPPRKHQRDDEDDDYDGEKVKVNDDEDDAKRANRQRRQLEARDTEDMGFEPVAVDDRHETPAAREAAPDGRARRQAPDREADGLEVDARTIKRLQDKYKACKLASKLLIIGNLAFGCQNYKRAQWQSCCFGARLAKSD